MECPRCGRSHQKVLEIRGADQGSANRRRRVCLNCNYRFTTYERIEPRRMKISKQQKKIINERREYFVTEDLADLFSCHVSTIRSIKRGDYAS